MGKVNHKFLSHIFQVHPIAIHLDTWYTAGGKSVINVGKMFKSILLLMLTGKY